MLRPAVGDSDGTSLKGGSADMASHLPQISLAKLPTLGFDLTRA